MSPLNSGCSLDGPVTVKGDGNKDLASIPRAGNDFSVSSLWYIWGDRGGGGVLQTRKVY